MCHELAGRMGMNLEKTAISLSHAVSYSARRVSLIATTMLVAGCSSVGPDYEVPESPMPMEYEWIDIDAPGINSESADLARWWTVFNDPGG